VLFRSTLDWCEKYWDRVFGDRMKPGFLTVHGSKGLEFPVVFLCDLEEGVFPHYRKKRKKLIETWGAFFRSLRGSRGEPVTDYDLEEERRLFYVGVTRAQSRLYLCSVRKKEYYGRKQSFERSRFTKLV
jgi:DNA helicase II / ATP-dependent DNA helicase PcrA